MGKNKSHKKREALKRTIQFLAVSPNHKVTRAVIQSGSNAVVRALLNAAVNALKGDVVVPPHLQPLFRHHRHHFEYLCDHHPIHLKRRLIVQQGGFLPVVVPLLATVLGSLGTEFISRIFKHDDND